MAALHKVLAAKQARMEEVIKNSAAMPVMKQHYDKMLLDLQADRDKLQKERMALHQVGGRGGRGEGRACVLPGSVGACCMMGCLSVHVQASCSACKPWKIVPGFAGSCSCRQARLTVQVSTT